MMKIYKMAGILFLSLALLGCGDGQKGDQGNTGAKGVQGPAGKDATTERFIFFTIPKNAEREISRSIQMVSSGSTLDLTKADCVRLTAEQVNTLVISLPKVDSASHHPAVPAVTLCDNTNSESADDCSLYAHTYIFKTDDKFMATMAIEERGEYSFADVSLSSTQQANSKTF